MRDLKFLFSAMILLCVVSCQKDEGILNLQNKLDQTFYATVENSINTRTTLDESNSNAVLWSSNDQISVFSGSSTNNSFILSKGANTTYGVFKANTLSAGTESDGTETVLSANVAYYPYDNTVTVIENEGAYTFNATFPTIQTYSASGTFGNGASPMVAVTSSTLDANLKFKNVGAIFRLQLKGEATITKVVFSANAALAGNCNIMASNNVSPVVNVLGGSKTITLDCGEGVELNTDTATNFVVALLPVADLEGGITISIYDNDGKKMVYTHKKDETITIERSKAYTTTEVTYNGDQEANDGDISSDENSYIISSVEGLKWVAEQVNSGAQTFEGKTISLANDIDLNNIEWTPIGTEVNNFKGTFEGNNKVIKNLTIKVTEAKEGKAYIGLFGYAKDVTIRNVEFENVNLNVACLDIDHSQGHIGAVAGSLEGTCLIENVTVKGDIMVEATVTANGASRVAVVAGGNSYGNVTMKNVHVKANAGSYLKANNNVGALAGQLQGVSVFEECSSNINVTGTKFFAGGIIGLAAGNQTFTDCQTTGNITITAGREGKAHDHYRVGGIAGGWADGAKNVCTLTDCSYSGTLSGTNADGSVAEAFDYAGYVGRGYTLNGCAGSKVVINGVEYVQVGNTAAEAGVYTVAGVYEMNTLADMQWLADKVNTGAEYFDGKTVMLANDIDLNNIEWTPIGTEVNNFKGTFEGNNKVIKNLTIKVTEAKEGKAYIGLFGYAKDVTIRNVEFENVNLNVACLDIDHSQGHIGAVAGSLEGTCLIENVTVKGDIMVEATVTANGASRVAVVAGGNSYGNVTMKNVHVKANAGSYLKANNNVGALAGQLQGVSVFEKCSSDINVTGTKFFAGGIIGLAAGDQTFTDCHTTGDVTITAGREGRNHDQYRVGGIAGGWADGATKVCTLTNCSYEGQVSGTNTDGSVAEPLDYAGYVGRGYTLNGCAGSKVVIDGVEYVQAFDEAANSGIYYVDGVLTINSVANFKVFASKVNSGITFAGKNVVLGADIDLKNEEWTPIGTETNNFEGNFDGKNKVVKNLKITTHASITDAYGTWAYAGLFGVTCGAENQCNSIKNLVIENINISNDGDIVAAAVAYPYYTDIENITIKGDINIKGGNYTAGILGYTRRCVNAKDLIIEGNEGSSIEGNSTVGGVISDIQMNGGLTANYSNFMASGLKITAKSNVGGISGIICEQTLDGASVRNVEIVCDNATKGIVSGALGGESTIKNIVKENVKGADKVIGAVYEKGTDVVVDGDVYMEATN